MKLIALINKKGIYYFSREYYVKYRAKSSIEIIKNKSNPNFSYGDNIKGLTCIVGGNGSGKTRFINQMFKNLVNNDKNNDFICQIFEKSGELVYVSNSKMKIEFEGKDVPKYSEENECIFIKYSAAIDTNGETNDFESENHYDISNTAKYFFDSLSNVSVEDMFHQVKFVSRRYSELVKESQFIKLDNKEVILTTSQHGAAILSNRSNVLSNFVINDRVIPGLKEFIDTSENKLIKVLRLKLISFIISFSDNSNKDTWRFYTEEFEFEENSNFKKILSDYLSFIKIDDKNNPFKNDTFENTLEIIGKFKKDNYKFSKDQDRLDLSELLDIIDNDGKNLLKELSSTIMFNWQSISSGEYGILNLFGRIESLNIWEEQKEKTIFLFIDEVDIGLHPEWQRRWSTIVPKYLGIILPDNKINFLLSTHSPIVLSDIPKNNIILLEDGAIYENMEETFGQNIHSLLTDSFFTTNTIGEFSKKNILSLLKIVSPIHEQLFADILKQEDSELITIIKSDDEEYDKWKENQGDFPTGEIDNIIKEVDNSDVNKTIEKLKKKDVIEKVFIYRAKKYLEKNNFINESSSSQLEYYIHNIGIYIYSIGEEAYRGHLLSKFSKLKNLLAVGVSDKINNDEVISALKNIKLNENEKSEIKKILERSSIDD